MINVFHTVGVKSQRFYDIKFPKVFPSFVLCFGPILISTHVTYKFLEVEASSL